MTFEESQQMYRDMKAKFFTGDLPMTREHAALIKNWVLSRDAGADPHRTALPPETRDLEVFQRLDDMYRWHLSYFDDFFQDSNKVLADLGCACFYIDKQFTVYYKCGNRGLIDELKAKGIRIGANLSVANIGAFAGNIDVYAPYTNVLTMGETHYSDILSEYGCMARYGESTEFSSLKSNKVIFFPLRKYSKALHASLEFILASEDTAYRKFPAYPQIMDRLHLVEKSAVYSMECILIIDKLGNIAFFNQLFEKEFKKNISTKDVNLTEFMPELSEVMNYLNQGNSFQMKELFIPNSAGRQQSYLVDCLVMKDDSNVIGAKLTFHPKKKLMQAVSKYNEHNAFFTFEDILGESAPMLRVKALAKKAAASSSNIIITGESGTGKELFAHAIHNASDRASGPFIPINCGAIPGELIGTELFGYSGGAFTGANKNGSPGKIEQADGGTLFLDEIGEMPIDMQVYLLRFLENGVISRIGSNKYFSSDVRIIAATNRDLRKSIDQGSFRLDLFYRLNVISITLPALREHMEDIELLANHYVRTIAEKNHKTVTGIPAQGLDRLRRNTWPGNIRELRNYIERCVVETPDGSPLIFPAADEPSTPYHYGTSGSYPMSADPIPHFQDYERQQIRELMLKYRGNKTSVAQTLGISRGTLYKKLREMGYE